MSQQGPNLIETSKGYAVARLCGRTIHFGRMSDPEARVRFAAFKAAWEACGRSLPPSAVPARGRRTDELTVEQLVDRYLADLPQRHPPRWIENNMPRQRLALAVVRMLYGPEPAAQFSPKRLQVVRKSMIDSGRLCRREVNDRLRIVREAFVWAVAEELAPGHIAEALACVKPVRHGEYGAREGKGRRFPVEPWVVDATLPFLRRPVAAIVQLLRITGARPSEILSLRPCDIDRSEDSTWLVLVTQHKNAHRGKARVLVFDEPAQAVLRPFLARPADRYLFRPLEAVDELHELRRQLRLRDGGTPLYRSHVARYDRDCDQRPRQEFAECFGADSLRQAIERRRAGVLRRARCAR